MTRFKRPGMIAMALGLFLLLMPLAALSATDKDKKGTPLPEGVSQGIEYLSGMLLGTGTTVDEGKLAPLIDYVAQGIPDAEKLTPKKREEGTGSVYYDEFQVNFHDLVQYFYNPAIPNFLIVPSVLRASGWQPGSDILTRNIKLWELLDTYDQPIVLRGSEYEVNTPDSFGGCYYSYDLYRMLVLLKHNGQNVLLSVSKQKDKSDVGRKAVIIDDKDFVYFYSGIEGLDRGLIGWMDTYMYGSFAVQVYYEKSPQVVSNALFKWLSAGWAGMNVVKRSHIYDGAQRYANGLKGVLESGKLPPADLFAERIRQIDALPKTEVDKYIHDYARNFEQSVKNHEGMDSRDFQKIIADGGYAEVLDDKARMDTLYLEYLKHMIGKPSLVQLDLPPLADPALAETPATSPEAGAVAEGVAQGATVADATATASATTAETDASQTAANQNSAEQTPAGQPAAEAAAAPAKTSTTGATAESVADHAFSHLQNQADSAADSSAATVEEAAKVRPATSEGFGQGLGGEPASSSAGSNACPDGGC